MLWRTKVVRTKLFTLSGVMTGVGLFFIPWLVGYPNIVVSAFTRPLVELTSLYSVNLTNFLPLCNALFLGLMMLCTWQSKTGRMIVAGAGVGMAGYTASQIVLGTLFIPLGSFTIPVLVVNALFCLFVSNFNLKHLNDPTPDANQPI